MQCEVNPCLLRFRTHGLAASHPRTLLARALYEAQQKGSITQNIREAQNARIGLFVLQSDRCNCTRRVSDPGVLQRRFA